MYRDDDEAAQARADALQVELDETRRKLEDAEALLAAADAELADADATKRDLEATRHKLDETEADLSVAILRKQPPRQKKPPSGRSARSGKTWLASAAWTVLGGFVGFAIATIVLTFEPRSPPRQREQPDPHYGPTLCTLRTVPDRAQIIARCKNRFDGQPTDPGQEPGFPFEMRLGTSPLTRPRQEWLREGGLCQGYLIARLAGYADTRVTVLEGDSCRYEVFHLDRP